MQTYRESSAVVAYSQVCSVNTSQNRPDLGLMVVNEKSVVIAQNKIKEMEDVILHEMYHIFVFSPSLYTYFINGMKSSVEYESIITNTGKKTVTKFVTPKLVQLAKDHFGCDTINGVYLENEGGETSAASHFEKVLFGNEMMTGV